MRLSIRAIAALAVIFLGLPGASGAQLDPMVSGQLLIQGNQLTLFANELTTDADQTINVNERAQVRTCFGGPGVPCGSVQPGDPRIAGASHSTTSSPIEVVLDTLAPEISIDTPAAVLLRPVDAAERRRQAVTGTVEEPLRQAAEAHRPVSTPVTWTSTAPPLPASAVPPVTNRRRTDVAGRPPPGPPPPGRRRRAGRCA